ncbi:hypothetical protein Krac_8430 [Ktedonobacter racemifer DSM 44963]|uniref:Uncharacterized protein n=2 Tax=Ktedonobacter racemifer TaxID=363277 RepID=D6TMV6_KTERA|nr:hypothetical protein Krac_8430 [Ktedonobacter racemifer DSM 44963]
MDCERSDLSGGVFPAMTYGTIEKKEYMCKEFVAEHHRAYDPPYSGRPGNMRSTAKHKQRSCQTHSSRQTNWWTWWICFWGAYWIFRQWLIALAVVGFFFLLYTAWKNDWLHLRKPTTVIYVSKPMSASPQVHEQASRYERGYQGLDTPPVDSAPLYSQNRPSPWEYEQPSTQYPEQEPPAAMQ